MKKQTETKKGKPQVANDKGTEEARIDYENQENYSGQADQEKRVDFAKDFPRKK